MSKLNSNLFYSIPDLLPLYFAPTEVPLDNNRTSREDILDELNADDDEVIELDDKGKKIKGKEDEDEDSIRKNEKKGKETKEKVNKDDRQSDKDEDDENEESKERKGKGKEDEEELDELSELEDELEEPDEDKLEYVNMPRRKEILKEFPNLYKKFPQLEAAYYREQQFTQLFPTMDEAKDAVDKVKILDSFENDLKEGNIATILKSVKEEAPNSFNKVVDNYLKVLYDIDPNANQHVIGRIIQDTVVAMVEEASSSDNAALREAANLVHQFVFGTSKFKRIEPLHDPNSDKNNKKDDVIDEREKQFTQRRFETTRDELDNKVETLLLSTIGKYIDPRDSMSDFVKKHATKEALESLNSLIDKDTRFRRILDKLWERAFESDFDNESVAKIRQAYTAKAKTLLPSVIKKARQDALKGVASKKKDTDEDTDDDTNDEVSESRKEQSNNRGRSASRNSGHKTAKGDGRGMSTLDFLNSD